MSERPSRTRQSRTRAARLPLRLLIAATALAAAAACGGAPTADDVSASSATLPNARAAAAEENRDLATLRSATAGFHNYDAAYKAGYRDIFMNVCMEDASGQRLGGMGYHYVNGGLLNGTAEVASPEALLYEPGSNGQLRLVGVEYVVPMALWTEAEPPRLFGREFKPKHFDPDIDLWTLHVWVWKDNPSGMYADWNPRVSCEYAAPAARGSHD